MTGRSAEEETTTPADENEAANPEEPGATESWRMIHSGAPALLEWVPDELDTVFIHAASLRELLDPLPVHLAGEALRTTLARCGKEAITLLDMGADGTTPRLAWVEYANPTTDEELSEPFHASIWLAALPGVQASAEAANGHGAGDPAIGDSGRWWHVRVCVRPAGTELRFRILALARADELAWQRAWTRVRLDASEEDALIAIASGEEDREVESRLGIAPVGPWLRALYDKLGVGERHEAAVWAVDSGLVRPADVAPAGVSAAALSKRRRAVLKLLHAGDTYAQVAQDLGIGVDTVRVHVHKSCEVLGVNNRAHLLAATRHSREVRGE